MTAPGPQVAERPDRDALADGGALEDREPHAGAGADRACRRM